MEQLPISAFRVLAVGVRRHLFGRETMGVVCIIRIIDNFDDVGTRGVVW